MFSNTAYDAFYTYIGLSLHSEFIRIITSQSFFAGGIVLIFGVFFFLTAWRFFSNYVPGSFVRSGGETLSGFAKIVACLFLGITLLKVDSSARVNTFKRVSWHTNSYLTTKLPDLKEQYQVSFVFDLITRTSEELARFAAQIVDNLFKVTNSQLEAPSYFYKAIMFASVGTIDDPALKDKVKFYTSECIDKILPAISDATKRDRLDLMFAEKETDPLLSQVQIENEGGPSLTCLDLKNEVMFHLKSYATSKTGQVPPDPILRWSTEPTPGIYENLFASQALVNHYIEQREGWFGVQKGSQVPGTTGRVIQYLNRLKSFDGWLSLLGLADYVGVSETATRSQEFSEHLQRAPHVQGFVKMLLIMIFPWLIFFVVAGKWRVLIYWTAIYTSVLFWTPIWALFYHITTNIALSTETLAAFGKLSDGISLYSSQLVSSRLYLYYATYSWIQLLLGPLPTLYLASSLRPLIANSKEERLPEIVNDAKNIGQKAISAFA
ncbi:MAG: hypothetical protein AB7T49_06640 [Oligoflexales bacterium]